MGLFGAGAGVDLARFDLAATWRRHENTQCAVARSTNAETHPTLCRHAQQLTEAAASPPPHLTAVT